MANISVSFPSAKTTNKLKSRFGPAPRCRSSSGLHNTSGLEAPSHLEVFEGFESVGWNAAVEVHSIDVQFDERFGERLKNLLFDGRYRNVFDPESFDLDVAEKVAEDSDEVAPPQVQVTDWQTHVGQALRDGGEVGVFARQHQAFFVASSARARVVKHVRPRRARESERVSGVQDAHRCKYQGPN